MKFFKNYIKQNKRTIYKLIPLYAATTLAGLFMPFIMSNIVSYGIGGKDMNYILVQGGIMAALALVGAVCSVFAVKMNARLSADFSGELFKELFRKVNTFTMEEFLTMGTSSLLTRSTHDVFIIHEFSSNFIYVAVNIPILFIGGFILSAIKDYVLALILLAAAPLIILIVWLITRRMNKLWEQADKHIDDQNKIVRERLSGIRVIRAFDREDYEHGRMATATKRMASNIIKANTVSGAVMPTLSLLFNLAIIAVLYVGSIRMQTNTHLSAGNILASVQYVTLIMFGCFVLTFGLVFLPQIKVSIRRINEIFNTPGDKAAHGSGEKLDGSITFENVSFFYPKSQAPALKDISFSVKSGETVAVIGGTGSGKTTLTRLLLHFYNPTEGDIILGGKRNAEIDRETARDNISIVLQKGMIFHTTIGENIRVGKPGATDEEMKKAAATAQIASFIESLPDGYNHMLTESGSNISGGQKQRVNIARALIKVAAVYIFDDSFSNLDFITEAKLRSELKKELHGKTQLIITQRAATAMHCDRIIVLNEGKLDGVGTHKELLESSAIYKEIVRSQMG